MSPFDQFLLESRKIRAKYNVWMLRKPAEKDALAAEMNEILEKLLDECEQREQGFFKAVDQLSAIGINPKAAKKIPHIRQIEHK